MKKIILISLITTLCLITFISCNSDAINGIYRDIAESQPNTDVTMISYLGHTSEPDTYYYLADDGVYSYSNGVTKAIRTSDSEKSVRGAYLDVSGKKLYFFLAPKGTSAETEIQYCDLKNIQQGFQNVKEGQGSEMAVAEEPSGIEGVKGLLTNGFCWTDKGIYKLSGGNATNLLTQPKGDAEDKSINVFNAMSSEKYAFFLLEEEKGKKYKIYVFDDTKKLTESGIDTPSNDYCGFQYIGGESGNEKFLLLSKDGKIKQLSNQKLEDFVSLGTSTTLDNIYNASFYSDKKAVIKCANDFIEIDIDNKKLSKKTNGYAQDISNAEITNIIYDGTEGQYIAGTTNGLLYKICVSKDKNELINGNITK